jgi:hypothetical protein
LEDGDLIQRKHLWNQLIKLTEAGWAFRRTGTLETENRSIPSSLIRVCKFRMGWVRLKSFSLQPILKLDFSTELRPWNHFSGGPGRASEDLPRSGRSAIQ